MRIRKDKGTRSRRVTALIIKVDAEELASYDDSGATGNRSCFVLEKGSYSFCVGNDVRSAEYVYRIEVDEDIVTRECVQAAAPVIPFEMAIYRHMSLFRSMRQTKLHADLKLCRKR